MNRINQKGMEVLEYKEQLTKDYPELVKNALLLSLEQKVENHVIDLDTFNFVKDEKTTYEELKQYLLTKADFVKTEEEIFAEFEVIRKKVDEVLTEKGLLQLKTESHLDKEAIIIYRKFCIDESFVMNYFHVEEKDLLKLMKRRGFVEKFAVLRLMAIFKGFMDQLDYSDELISCDVSLVYYDKEECAYSIDIYFELPIEEAEKIDKVKEFTEVILRVVEKAEKYYEERMIA